MNLDDLVFTGVLLASVDDQNRTQNSSTRLQLALYQTLSEAYILAITLHHNHEGAADGKTFNGAITFASLDDIHLFLMSEEGRAIADLVMILLDQVVQPQRETAQKRRGVHTAVTSYGEREEPGAGMRFASAE